MTELDISSIVKIVETICVVGGATILAQMQRQQKNQFQSNSEQGEQILGDLKDNRRIIRSGLANHRQEVREDLEKYRERVSREIENLALISRILGTVISDKWGEQLREHAEVTRRLAALSHKEEDRQIADLAEKEYARYQEQQKVAAEFLNMRADSNAQSDSS